MALKPLQGMRQDGGGTGQQVPALRQRASERGRTRAKVVITTVACSWRQSFAGLIGWCAL